jgi:hypothetical protein
LGNFANGFLPKFLSFIYPTASPDASALAAE